MSFTPPPGQNTRLDLSKGESSARGAFSLTNQTPVGAQPQEDATQSTNGSSKGISSARQGLQSARQDHSSDEQGTQNKVKWWIYPIAALV